VISVVIISKGEPALNATLAALREQVPRSLLADAELAGR
jgi:hypothetical protein